MTLGGFAFNRPEHYSFHAAWRRLRVNGRLPRLAAFPTGWVELGRRISIVAPDAAGGFGVWPPDPGRAVPDGHPLTLDSFFAPVAAEALRPCVAACLDRPGAMFMRYGPGAETDLRAVAGLFLPAETEDPAWPRLLFVLPLREMDPAFETGEDAMRHVAWLHVDPIDIGSGRPFEAVCNSF